MMLRSLTLVFCLACTVGDGGAPPDANSQLPVPGAVTCDANGRCGGKVGAIAVYGLAKGEAERVVAALGALPPSLTRDAPFDVTRDPVSQAGCPDPRRTPLGTQIDPTCGYAGVTPQGTRYVLALRDAALVTYPTRYEHVLADFATRMWYLAHADEVLAVRRSTWRAACYACSADALEPCAATSSDNQVIQVLRDFTSSASATLLGDRAWGHEGVRWVTAGGTPCADPARTAWIRERLVEERPSTLVTRAIDVATTCPPGATAVRYTLAAPATLPVTIASLGTGTTAKIFYYDNTATPAPEVRRISVTAGLARVVAWSSQPFTLGFVDCAP